MASGIVCKNLKKRVDEKVILNDISINASRGRIVALLGPNGAGKTTSFSMLCGLIKPDSGRIFLDGKDITELPMYKRARLGVGYLPQESSIFRGLTVEENIYAVIEMNGLKGAKAKELLDKLLNELSLEYIREAPAVSISGGERRKLEIARALANSPSFMLLDEPFAGIDPIAVAEMKNMILELKNKKGIGIVITDHNVRDTLPIADYAYILHDGNVLVEGKPKDIINDVNARKIYLGESFSGYTSHHGT
ncbi:MAG: LPS export ABC transporter ATP-binding protein [Holosporaceae bacterium]|jgi:lipopolysaccharide export system ATP-binding protein|nr:LPS export ABC transporter ATP-binding protein [Holosporaceae bacterium]